MSLPILPIITALPPAPSRKEPALFSARMDDFLGALQPYNGQLNALAAAIAQLGNEIATLHDQAQGYRNEANNLANVVAAGHAAAAATSAGAADTARGLAAAERAGAAQERQQAEVARDSARVFADAAGAAVGIAPGIAAKPLASLRVNAAGTGLEATYEVPAGDVKRKSLTAAYTVVFPDKGALLDCAGTWTLGFAAAATLGNGWWCYVRNTGAGVVTLDPAGAELVDGVATAPMPAGTTLLVTCDGTALNTLEIKRRRYDRRQLITSTGTFVVPPDVYVLRGYAVGAGANGAINGYGGAGGGMAYGDIPVKPGDILNISIAAGVAKVSKSGTDMLIGNPPASRTVGGTAAKHASVEAGGAYSGGTPSSYGGASSGSPLGVGKASGGGGAGWGAGYSLSGGGGAGGVSPNQNDGGPGLPQEVPITEPLLMGLTSPGPTYAGAGGPGAGGAAAFASGATGGIGGFGGGGGSSSTANGGAGGFGGGGGAGASGYVGGAGGFGGGGGSVTSSGAGGVGGAAAVIIIYG